MQFDDVVHLLPGYVDGTITVDEATRAYIETDLRCQAELVRYRRILRGLRALRGHAVEPAPGLLAQTLVALEEASERRVLSLVSGRRAALAGAIGTAVVTAGAATAAVLIARARRGRPAVAA